jgi:hypothetical protein
MRVRVSLDFDISIESFISLCIIETVGVIFRECSFNNTMIKIVQILALSLGLFDLQVLLTFIIRCTEV